MKNWFLDIFKRMMRNKIELSHRKEPTPQRSGTPWGLQALFACVILEQTIPSHWAWFPVFLNSFLFSAQSREESMSESVWAAQHDPVDRWFAQQAFMSHSSAGWQLVVRMPAWSDPGEGSLPGWQMAAFWLCLHAPEEKQALWCLFLEVLHPHDLITAQSATSWYHHTGIRASAYEFWRDTASSLLEGMRREGCLGPTLGAV